MAVPKRRTSKRKKRARNTHTNVAPAIVIQTCPQCGTMKRPHRVCAECGFYAGEQRVAAQEA